MNMRILPFQMPAACSAAIACFSWTLYGASAMLSGIDIIGSSKGVALTLRADAPFAMTIEEKAAPDPGKIVVGMHCTNALYGLEDFGFSSFPAGCPVERISVSESPAENSIDLSVTVAGSISRPSVSRQKDSKWIVLMSKEPAPEFSWSASPQPVSAAAPTHQKPAPKQPGASRLTDVSLLVRDKVRELTFSFDGPTVIRFKREPAKIVVLFFNATSGLPVTLLVPANDRSTAVELRQIAHGGTMWLGASVLMPKPTLQSALMQAFADRLVIYTIRDSLQSLSLWSAANGQSVQYNFAELPRLDVDIEGMKKKALTDLSGEMSSGKTFAVGEEAAPKASQKAFTEELPAAPASAAPSPHPARSLQVVVRLIVIKDNVNLRGEPSSGAAVISRLGAGTVGTLVEKKKEWIRMRTGDTAGWVSASMTVDSAAASNAQLENIDKLIHARLAKEEALREKAVKEQAAKEKAAQEKLAKEKLAADRQAKKKAEQEAKAAARDSAVRYATAVQESVTTVKSLQVRKPVEYHVYGRDPFLPLSGDEDNKVHNVEDLALVGILYDQADRIALFETQKGREKAIALRENDPVQNGYVLRIQPDKVLFLLNELGISRTYAVRLNRDKEN